ncbi:MAG: insulinase family protein [Spirochaetia bacterium]
MKNYKLKEVRNIEEYDGQVHHFLHEKTGAQVIAVQNQDAENFFCFGFSTPPSNSHGTAHILEHTVLCGSQHYQVKDPFLLLLRGSMQSFLNAMTYPDRTLYPAASPVEKDFFNLMSVYGDAVFFPLLKEEAFWQEGHRLTISNSALQHAGVVFNEMKGVYSSHENFAADSVTRSLFPHTCYRFDSGGDPADIPAITWNELKKFHKQHYHPSHARIFLYGNIDLQKKLDFLDIQFLSKFSAQEGHVYTNLENPFLKRIYVKEQFPASPGASELATVAVNWRLQPIADQKNLYALETLSHLLLGSSGAPFYFALQNSHLGEDVSPISGMSFDFPQAMFSAALRQVPAENIDKVEPLVDQALKDIVKVGIPVQDVEAALSAVEFSRRELRSGSVGLRLARRLYRVWQSDQNPLESLFFQDGFAIFRDQAKKQGFFEKMIQSQLLDNPSSSVLVVEPNFELFQQNSEKEEAQLAQIFASMSEEEKSQLAVQEEKLRSYQEGEDLDHVVPMLSRTDIPTQVVPIEHESSTSEQGFSVLCVPALAQGIYYSKFAFSLNQLETDEYIYLPLLTRIISGIGWQGVPYDQASREIVRSTASFSFGLDSGMALDGTLKIHLIVTLKALPMQRQSSLDVLMKSLLTPDYDEPSRIKEILFEFYNDVKSYAVQSGSSFVSLGLAQNYSASGYVDEQWHGLAQLFFLADIIEKAKTNTDVVQDVIAKCQVLHSKIFTRQALSVCVATDAQALDDAKAQACMAISALPEGIHPSDLLHQIQHANRQNYGYISASQVNFVGIGMMSASYGSKEGAWQQLLAHYLGSGPLWEQIRMKGGAYGAQAHFAGLDRVFIMSSYRDPHVVQTLRVYEKILHTPLSMSSNQLDQALISLIGREIRPTAIEEKLNIAMRRKILGISDAHRQRIRDVLLQVSVQDLNQAMAILASTFKDQGSCMVIGPELGIEEARGLGLLDSVKKLP